jgi:hypothetical protein
MKTQIRSILTGIAFGSLCALPALAEADAQRPRPNRAERPNPPNREEMLRRFDANGDGVLCDQERATARETMRKERQERRANQQGQNRPDQPGRPDREEMLRRFDADGDGVLSEEERATARETLRRERMERRAAQQEQKPAK